MDIDPKLLDARIELTILKNCDRAHRFNPLQKGVNVMLNSIKSGTMATEPKVESKEPPTRQRRPRDMMGYANVMRFQAWMHKDRIDGFVHKTDFCDAASKELGFTLSTYALDQWLELNKVAWPTVAQRAQSGVDRQLAQDIATLAICLYDIAPPAWRDQLKSIAQRWGGGLPVPD